MAERPDAELQVVAPRAPNAYDIVRQFEERVAAFTGAPFAVATDSCTAALLLCCARLQVAEVLIPARTYVSVPMAVLHAGGTVRFVERDWQGVYQLAPYPIWDAAKRFRRHLFREIPSDHSHWRYVCLSFHAKKLLPIGRGGMILTDDAEAAAWFRLARRDGRSDQGGGAWAEIVGWNCYLQPEQAARGLTLMDLMPPGGWPDMEEPGGYPDLRQMPAFRQCGDWIGERVI